VSHCLHVMAVHCGAQSTETQQSSWPLHDISAFVRGTQENHENPDLRKLFSEPKFKPATSVILSWNVNVSTMERNIKQPKNKLSSSLLHGAPNGHVYYQNYVCIICFSQENCIAQRHICNEITAKCTACFSLCHVFKFFSSFPVDGSVVYLCDVAY
jgi:hypothetical protein